MHTIRIEVGINYTTESHGHMPKTYLFGCDVTENLVGAYGISSDGQCLTRWFEVDVPDFITKGEWGNREHIGIPGRRSKSGSEDLAFVVCKKPIHGVKAQYFGSVDQSKLIDDALKGGLKIVYPLENGEMAEEDVAIVEEVFPFKNEVTR